MRKPHRSDRDPVALRVRFGAGDLPSPQVHSLAKAAKDLAAGRVLSAAMAPVAAGLLILGPPLWRKVGGG